MVKNSIVKKSFAALNIIRFNMATMPISMYSKKLQK